MEYITELRGGWDEWSDEYQINVAVIINGTEHSRFIKDLFTDTNGTTLEVEFPSRDNNIVVERYEPTYEVRTANTLEEFEDLVDLEDMTIEFSELDEYDGL